MTDFLQVNNLQIRRSCEGMVWPKILTYTYGCMSNLLCTEIHTLPLFLPSFHILKDDFQINIRSHSTNLETGKQWLMHWLELKVHSNIGSQIFVIGHLKDLCQSPPGDRCNPTSPQPLLKHFLATSLGIPIISLSNQVNGSAVRIKIKLIAKVMPSRSYRLDDLNPPSTNTQ